MESEAFGAGCCGLIALFYGFIGLISIAFLVFKIMMIIDCARKKFPGQNDMIVWILVIIFVPFGDFIYYFVVKFRDPESPGIYPRKAN